MVFLYCSDRSKRKIRHCEKQRIKEAAGTVIFITVAVIIVVSLLLQILLLACHLLVAAIVLVSGNWQ